MGNLVKHGESIGVEEAQAELARLQSEGGAGDFMKLAVGRNVVRFLPPKVGKKQFLVVNEHYIKIPGADRPAVFACPRAMAKERCPACDRADALRSSGNPADRDAAYQISAKMRVYAAVIDRKEPEKGPRILPFGKTIYEKLLTLRADADAGGDFADPQKGFDIIIERRGSGINTEYEVNPSRTLKPITADVAQASEWIEKQPDLEYLSRVRTFEELRVQLNGGGAGRAPAASTETAAGYTPPEKGEKKRTADDDLHDGVHGSDNVKW